MAPYAEVIYSNETICGIRRAVHSPIVSVHEVEPSDPCVPSHNQIGLLSWMQRVTLSTDRHRVFVSHSPNTAHAA